MAEDVHLNSIDEDNRKFVPDEVFETIDEAKETLEYLISCYDNNDSPLVFPIILKDNINIGYVQAILLEDNTYEIGYHIAKKYTNNNYATEALQLFLPYIMNRLNIKEILGICLKENIASCRVLEKAGFIKYFDGICKYQEKDSQVVKYKFVNE